MESLAEQFRGDLGLSVDDKLDPLKLEIEGIEIMPLSKVTGFDEEAMLLLKEEASSKWSAMSIPLDMKREKWMVVYNDSHDVERQRPTLLEEIWHIILEHDLTQITKIGSQHARTFNQDDEHDAYYLASAALLPAEAIKGFVQDKLEKVESFAKKYGVSKELVEYRIKRLGFWYEYKGRSIRLKP